MIYSSKRSTDCCSVNKIAKGKKSHQIAEAERKSNGSSPMPLEEFESS
jgi:hypothetical protein